MGTISNVCPRCYPLLAGAQTVCREHRMEEAFKPFVDACRRYEENGNDFEKAFHGVSVADIRRAAVFDLT